MEQLNKILAEYVKRLGNDYETAIATGNATPELSFRPALDDFLVQMSGFIDRKIDRGYRSVSDRPGAGHRGARRVRCAAVHQQVRSGPGRPAL